ncbi:MAG: hypothetical protein ABI340_06505 [Nitrososphaera sp.]|jgi:transcriptional regulator of heat shock response
MTKDTVEKRLDELENKIDRIMNILEDKLNILPREESYTKQRYETKPKPIKEEVNQYKGLVGGVQYLVDNNYFNELRSMREIFEELKKEGYYYSLQAVDTILRRDFVLKKKILTRTQEDGVWKYIRRK